MRDVIGSYLPRTADIAPARSGSSGPTDGRIIPDTLTKFAVPIQIFPDALIRELRDMCVKVRGILARRTDIKSKFEEIPCKFPC
jgi:hypothetical protein